MVAATYFSYLLMSAVVHTAVLAPTGNKRNLGDDRADGFQKSLQFIHGPEFKVLIGEINVELDSQNVNCVSQYGQHWFFYQELECRFCGDVCSPGTQTDECIKHCSSYWQAMEQKKTHQAQEQKIEDLERSLEKYEAISIASIAIAVLGLLAICACVILNRKWFANKYKGLVETFQKKTVVAEADSEGHQLVRQPQTE